MSNLVGQARAAIDTYNMINNNDKIAICVSGGKDSVFLLYVLSQIQNYYPKNFELVAITVDPCFNGKETDYSEIEKLCKTLNIKYTIHRSQLGNLIFTDREEKNPCSLCSRMRKGMLNNMAKELGCNKIALGHNFEDAAETFLMNLLNCGHIGCFSPISYLSRKDIYMIRPLIFCEENKIISAVKQNKLPIIKSSCPANGNTERQNTKELLFSIEKKYPHLRKKIIGAMQRSNIDNWGSNKL